MKNYLLFILCFFLSFGLFAQGNISGVVINEVLLDPNTTTTPSGCTGSGADNSSDIDNDGMSDTDDEFVELYNTTGSPVDIGGWTLADNDGTSFTFPGGTMIAAN